MKRVFIITAIVFSLIVTNCKADNPAGAGAKASAEGSVVQLTDAVFKKTIFNYGSSKEWKFEGSKPVIIDFYADWCAPCRQLSPLVEEIAKEYDGRIVVYKVDTEKEKDLARAIGITGLPTLLFIPAEGTPRMSMGLLPKADLVKAINEVLLIK